ncbi:hypothetical protein VNO78_34508 [Psophocarpus tetragonolobus]|uniref:Uncharacterized protein n=1 Tax=Psophocarpus tetragonolobus TaxID=3891 RepID=A0AAN9RHJ1_PSOTE
MMPCGVLVCCLNTKSNHRGSVISKIVASVPPRGQGRMELKSLSSKNDKYRDGEKRRHCALGERLDKTLATVDLTNEQLLKMLVKTVIQAKSSHRGCITRLFIHYKLLKIPGIA